MSCLDPLTFAGATWKAQTILELCMGKVAGKLGGFGRGTVKSMLWFGGTLLAHLPPSPSTHHFSESPLKVPISKTVGENGG